MLVVRQRPVVSPDPGDRGVAPPNRRTVGVVVAAGDQESRAVGAADPVLQLCGQRLGDAQLGQHHDGGTRVSGEADEPLEVAALLGEIGGPDRWAASCRGAN